MREARLQEEVSPLSLSAQEVSYLRRLLGDWPEQGHHRQREEGELIAFSLKRLYLNRMPVSRPLLERFWEKVNKDGPIQSHMTASCWVWTASVDDCGYGLIGLGVSRKLGKAHRVSWEIHFGEILDGLCVLHKCDFPGCVRPDHLFLGTQKINAQDREAKNRGNHPCGPRANAENFARGDAHWTRQQPERVTGENNGRAKLCEEDVRAIRTRYSAGGVLYKDLALEYGLDASTIGDIVRGELWSHVR
jgi:HNH endonuclease